MNLVKKLIKKSFDPLVWDSLGRARQEYRYSKKRFHCDSNLVPIFEKYLGKQGGYYIEVGANDGRSGSNTFHLEKFQGWHGILVEPIMHLYFNCRRNRDTRRNLIFNCACVDFGYREHLVEFMYSGMMTISTSLPGSNDVSEWTRAGSRFLSSGETVQKTWSLARTLDSILVESKAPTHIDFISIDVEGAEYSVLSGIDFERFVFDYILIETSHNSPSYNLLLELGYECKEIIMQNILFGKTNVLS